jgi:flagellar hook-associated protein 1 FlgK
VNLVAAASPIKTLAGTISSSNVVTNNNKGTASISAGSVETGYSAPASGSPVTLAYDSSTTSLTGFPTGTVTVTNGGTTTTYDYPTDTVPYTSGATISFSGISFEITGTPSNGDTFTVARNSSGTSDGRNALALGNLQTAKTMAGNTASYESAYAQLVSDIGNKTREVSVTETAQQSLLDQATSASQSLSGVNLDEEAANLLKYQEAYQASAKVISTASTLFDAILAIN